MVVHLSTKIAKIHGNMKKVLGFVHSGLFLLPTMVNLLAMQSEVG